MRIEHQFSIAGFEVSVSLPEGWDADTLLPSFRPFYGKKEGQEKALLKCTVCTSVENKAAMPSGELIENTLSDMGYVSLYKEAEGYCVTLSAEQGGTLHVMQADRCFSVVSVFLHEEDKRAGHALSSLLRIAYSQAVLYRDAVSIHASAVFCENQAFLFMGKSGTGKSTHSALWLKFIPGTELLNDDNPTLRIVNGRVYAYGTPWSGKTPCYKPLSYPVGGMVRLKQAPANRFVRQQEVEAFIALFPGCCVIHQDAELRACLYDTLIRMVEQVPVGVLECRPDEEAALLCRNMLLRTDK